MSKRKNVIRIGDKVKIINPEVYLRTGYPLTTDMIKESHITDEQRHLLDKLMETTGNRKCILYGNNINFEYEKLEHVFSTIVLKSKGFGGNERKVHTETKPEYQDRIGTVMSKRYVKVGTYNSGHSHQGYYDEYPEYEPPYLSYEKTVIIYNVSIGERDTIFNDYIEFPQSSVEKIVPTLLLQEDIPNINYNFANWD
jgi:hypothetical protein